MCQTRELSASGKQMDLGRMIKAIAKFFNMFHVEQNLEVAQRALYPLKCFTWNE